MDDKKPSNLAQIPNQRKYESAPKKEDLEKAAAEFEKLKTKLDDFRKKVVKKYKFTVAIGVLPGNACPLFEEDEALPKEIIDSKPIHLIMIIPEEEFKNIPKIKPEVVKLAKESKS